MNLKRVCKAKHCGFTKISNVQDITYLKGIIVFIS